MFRPRSLMSILEVTPMPKITSVMVNQNDRFICIGRPNRPLQPYPNVSSASMRRLTDHLNRSREFNVILTGHGFYAHRPAEVRS